MSRIFLYRKADPEGVIFDTEPGRPDPEIPHNFKMLGWTENRGDLLMTQDEVIEAVVKNELARQKADKGKLEREFKRKTGADPHFAAKEETLVKVLDSPLAPKENGA
jgi:hypothetical protein